MFPAEHFRTPVTVETLSGRGAYGPVFEPARRVMCWPQEETRQVPSASGEDVISSTRLWCLARERSKFLVGSRVTVNGRQTEVITARVHNPGAIPMSELLEVSLR